MSTFGGKIQEIPGISVDKFCGENLESEVYFLSHCHRDHMVGLNYMFITCDLINKNKYLYASDISIAIIKRLYPTLSMSNLKELDMYKPTFMTLKEGQLSVLPIPAGHCPGSVMFLFETKDTSVLYTGDYRINKSDIRKLKSFYDSLGQVKVIEKIYLDTTFFLKRYLHFPKRGESLKEMCKIMKVWLDKRKRCAIDLTTSAKYGYEYVFKEVYKEFGMPVHVNEDVYKFYSTIPELDNTITLDGSLTRIHCSCDTYPMLCENAYQSSIRSIKLSAFRWRQNDLENGISSNTSDYTYYVCYSTHASYEEGLELIRFLKPKSIEACVLQDPETNVEIFSLIEAALAEYQTQEELQVMNHKLFAIEESPCEREIVEEARGSRFAILDSPPSERKKTFEISRKENVNMLRTVSKSKSDSLQNDFDKITIVQNESLNSYFQSKVDVELKEDEPPVKKLK